MKFPSLLRLNDIPFYVYTTFCLFICPWIFMLFLPLGYCGVFFFCPFHWVDIYTNDAKQRVGKTAGALAQIKMEAPNYAINYCNHHCHIVVMGKKFQFHLRMSFSYSVWQNWKYVLSTSDAQWSFLEEKPLRSLGYKLLLSWNIIFTWKNDYQKSYGFQTWIFHRLFFWKQMK